jgi:hypothetical protein
MLISLFVARFLPPDAPTSTPAMLASFATRMEFAAADEIFNQRVEL